VTAITATANHKGATAPVEGADIGNTKANHDWSMALNASMIVSQLSHAKLPDATSHS